MPIPLPFGAAIAGPPIAVGVGILVVLVLMLGLRVHAFLALLASALLVSLLTFGAEGAVAPVLDRFGATAGQIGVVIALAAVIGKCLLASGAADRIVGANVSLLGERRAPSGLMAGGFVLAIPVFFDTVFYLLVPLARSLHRRTGAGYALCLMALAGGAAAAHALVPPTPGPLVVAEAFGVSVAAALGFGTLVAVPACVVAYAVAVYLDGRNPIAMLPIPGEEEDLADAPPGIEAMSLWMALAPITVPIVLIAGAAALDAAGYAVSPRLRLFGNPNVALFISALISLNMLRRAKGLSLRQLSGEVEESLLGAGVIILITAAGGAFGGALKSTGIAEVIGGAFDVAGSGRVVLLCAAFALASLLKIAQGSSTVAMIVGSSMVAAVVPVGLLDFHPAYLALAVGSGSLVGSWMNDSGFWIFSKMGGLTERQTLATWTPLFASVGIAAFVVTLLLSLVLPLR